MLIRFLVFQINKILNKKMSKISIKFLIPLKNRFLKLYYLFKNLILMHKNANLLISDSESAKKLP